MGGWTDIDAVRARLRAGADPDKGLRGGRRPLHAAALWGSPEVVGELARVVKDVDAAELGRTALWLAVHAGRSENARALVDAGADPWKPMMSGWSPGRLSQAGPHPRLFGAFAPAGHGLSAGEVDLVVEARRLARILDGHAPAEGHSLVCVRGIDVAEAVARLDARPLIGDADPDPRVVGLTDVPGGVVVSQPWGPAAATSEIGRPLSENTVAYSVHAHHKAGPQGASFRDGWVMGWDLHPGGESQEGDPAEEVLLGFLHRHRAMAYACAFAGVRPQDPRAFTGEPDVWVRLPPVLR